MNPVLTMNKATFWLFIGIWPVWIVWELILIRLRGQNPSIGLISMVARDRGYQFTAMVFAWGSLAAHYWANWRHLPWDNPFPAIMFWVLIVAVIVWDSFLWSTPYITLPLWIRCVRFPGTMLFLGLLNGFLLFPQRGISGIPV